MQDFLKLPDYRAQSAQVSERFARIRSRPVVLRVEQVQKSYAGGESEAAALRNVTLEVHRREFITVIGPSGCGKSTLVRIVAGLEEPTSGRVLLNGQEISGPGPDRGMVFQSYTLFPWLTVKRNVMFGPRMKGTLADAAETQARQWLDMVGLLKYENAYPHELSGGMKQRVAIARALAGEPSILLMDEPFGALDSQTRAQMQSYLLQIWKQVDLTILFITHDLEEAAYLSDRVLVMGCGHVLEMIENPVPRPRSPEQLFSPEFLALKRRLEDLIYSPAEMQMEKLPDIKLTPAGDDVE
jgi:NitT/TauT family transport system ATP-binding protein